ncbi:hypothetical protein BJ165DRAFT_1616181 [Panaeolus papilionaceus]|nr:hypothetical protein BJ165DRAFT_1616181 [Panaeolus papilionaceus]
MNLYLVSKWESAYDGIYFTEEKLPVYRVTFTETSTSAKRSNSLTIERATIDSQQNLPKYHSLAEFEFHRKRADVLKINEVTYEADEFFSKNKQLIAVFHARKHSLLGIRPGSPPYLEITPAGMEMLDLVFCTFIYVEKIRSERQQNASLDWDRPV